MVVGGGIYCWLVGCLFFLVVGGVVVVCFVLSLAGCAWLSLLWLLL